MKTSTSKWIPLALIALFGAGACAAPTPPEQQRSTASHLKNKAAAGAPGYYTVPQGDGYDSDSINYPTFYFGDADRQACGGDYSVDMSVQFGRVTGDAMEVRSVTITYHSSFQDGNEVDVVPTDIQLYAKDGRFTTPFEGYTMADGLTKVYPVGQTFGVTAGQPLTIQFGSAPGLASGDTSDVPCHQEAVARYAPDDSAPPEKNDPPATDQPPADSRPVSCSCEGFDLNGNAVHGDCGDTTCAGDYRVWQCTVDGFEQTEQECGN